MAVYPNDRLVRVTWIDSLGGGHWCAVDREKTISLPRCVSVGYLMRETDEYLMLVPHWHPKDEAAGSVEAGCGDMSIPRVAVLEIVDLAVVGASVDRVPNRQHQPGAILSQVNPHGYWKG